MGEDVAEADDVSCVRDLLRERRRNSTQLAHGLTTYFQRPFDGCARFVVVQVLFQCAACCETQRGLGVTLDVFQMRIFETRGGSRGDIKGSFGLLNMLSQSTVANGM